MSCHAEAAFRPTICSWYCRSTAWISGVIVLRDSGGRRSGEAAAGCASADGVTDVAAASVTVRAGVLTVTVGGGGGDDAFDDDRIDKIRAAATPAATSTTTIRVTRTTC